MSNSNFKLASAVVTAVSLSLAAGCDGNNSGGTSGAADEALSVPSQEAADNNMVADSREKCVPVVNGKNLVAAGKSDCATSTHSCAGQNTAGDADAWVYVSQGDCDKVKAGQTDDLPMDVQSKLDLSGADKSSCSGKMMDEKSSCSGQMDEKSSCSGK